MECTTRSGRIFREAPNRKERRPRPSPLFFPLSEGPILKCSLRLTCEPGVMQAIPLIFFRPISDPFSGQESCARRKFCIK